MTEHKQKLLRAMMDARRKYEETNEVQRLAWRSYLEAQSAFLGQFAKSDYPIGPFVCGDVLIEHASPDIEWPPSTTVFEYRGVMRCPTSD